MGVAYHRAALTDARKTLNLGVDRQIRCLDAGPTTFRTEWLAEKTTNTSALQRIE